MSLSSLLNKSVLITGGAGFIGSNIAKQMLKLGVKSIRILDNLVTGKMENIQFLLDKYENLENGPKTEFVIKGRNEHTMFEHKRASVIEHECEHIFYITSGCVRT